MKDDISDHTISRNQRVVSQERDYCNFFIVGSYVFSILRCSFTSLAVRATPSLMCSEAQKTQLLSNSRTSWVLGVGLGAGLRLLGVSSSSKLSRSRTGLCILVLFRKDILGK